MYVLCTDDHPKKTPNREERTKEREVQFDSIRKHEVSIRCGSRRERPHECCKGQGRLERYGIMIIQIFLVTYAAQASNDFSHAMEEESR